MPRYNGVMFRFAGVLLLAAACLQADNTPITISVDATEAPRKLLHAKVVIPAKAGPLTLAYPKWIPGEHMPDGPIDDLVNLRLTAAGKTLAWRRDAVDMYAIHCDVPAGATTVEADFDVVMPPGGVSYSSGASSTAKLAVVSWNQVLLYPKGAASDSLTYKANLRVPQGWKFASALRIERESGDAVEFKPASLTTVVDSPVLAGQYLRTVELTPGEATPHYLHIAADSQSALELKPEQIQSYKQLVAEAQTLYGAHHYGRYDFLVTLSDHVAHFGLEHHESSDNRIPEESMTDDVMRKLTAGLLPHEYTHSWNGKFRRPTGLATSDYDKPMEGELLWIYEGLTTYLGNILTPRSGLLTADEYRQELAGEAAAMDNRTGRRWRPLADTAIGAQTTYTARGDWQNLRRSADFYPEGALVWLDADVTIRRLSNGRRSLDDFCRRFHGAGGNTGPMVKTYTLDDVVADLNAVQPHDWREFFEQRVYKTNERAPLGGIEQGGWKLVYTDTPTELQKAASEKNKRIDFSYSVGLMLGDDGEIGDIVPGLAADKAGIAPATKLIAVNGRKFTPRVMRDAIKAAQNSTDPIEFLIQDGEFYRTFKVDYHGGERYPRLERVEGKPDLLSEIIRPHAAR